MSRSWPPRVHVKVRGVPTVARPEGDRWAIVVHPRGAAPRAVYLAAEVIASHGMAWTDEPPAAWEDVPELEV